MHLRIRLHPRSSSRFGGVTRLALPEIRSLAFEALRRCGASELQAGPTADSIADAEAEGIPNVGLRYLPTYCEHLLCSKVVGSAVPKLTSVEGAVCKIDAANGFSHPAFALGRDQFVSLAKAHGIAAMIISHSYSAGVLGWFVDALARQGLIGLCFANSPSLVAPVGGARPFFGTNPMAFAAPRAKADPVVMDLSTSATAWVNVKEAADAGRPIPPEWAQDVHGNPTSDAAAGLAGSIRPLGGAKGFALGLMVDVLAAGLSGGAWSFESSSFGDNVGGPPDVGQLLIAISPGVANPGGGDFAVRLETMIDALLAEGPDVRLPGDRRHAFRSDATTNGVEVSADLIALISSIGG